MRKILMLAAVGVLFSGLGLLRADDGGRRKPSRVTALCQVRFERADAKKCQNVVTVTKDGKKTKYYLTASSSKTLTRAWGSAPPPRTRRSRSRSPARSRRRATRWS